MVVRRVSCGLQGMALRAATQPEVILPLQLCGFLTDQAKGWSRIAKSILHSDEQIVPGGNRPGNFCNEEAIREAAFP